MRIKHLFILFLVMAVLCGCNREEGTGGMAMPPTEVGYFRVKTRNIQLWQELSGRVKASLQADVRPQVDGIIQERLFDEGRLVNAQQVLYRLDSASYQAAYNQAAAALKNAEANITAARLKSERYAELSKEDGIARQDVDDAAAAYQQTLAEVEEKRALLETARINLERTEIKAPISGSIGFSTVTVGQLVNANQSEALAIIRCLDPVYVDIPQSSVQKLQLRRLIEKNILKNGMAEVQLKLEDDSLYGHKGSLQLQEVSVDESTGSVTLRAMFPNPEGVLLPGMFVRALVNDALHENVVLVKQQALTRNAKEEGFVMVLTDDDIVEQRKVATGPSVDDKWIVFEGLEPGDRVILEGLGKIKAGDKVVVVEIDMPEDDDSQELSAFVKK